MSKISKHGEILPPLREADELSEVEWLIDLMDTRFLIPGTKYRFGMDAVLGLVPAAGDAISTAISGYIFYRLRKAGLPWHAQARMIANILFDFGLGAIPLVGDLLDIGMKANRANLKIARNYSKPAKRVWK